VIWFALGLILGAMVTLVITLARASALKVCWYQWPLALVASAMLLIALQNYLACQEELEPRLGLFSLLVFGLPAVVSVFLLLVTPFLRRNGRIEGGERQLLAPGLGSHSEEVRRDNRQRDPLL